MGRIAGSRGRTSMHWCTITAGLIACLLAEFVTPKLLVIKTKEKNVTLLKEPRMSAHQLSKTGMRKRGFLSSILSGSFFRSSSESSSKSKKRSKKSKKSSKKSKKSSGKGKRGGTTQSTIKQRIQTPPEEPDSEEVFDEDCQCGISGKLGAEPRATEIIGGSRPEKHQYPWMVRIFGGCPRSLCTGVLISEKHVLTAFHCMLNSDESDTEPCDHSDGGRRAFLGGNYFDRETEEGIPMLHFDYPDPTNAGPFKGTYEAHDLAVYILYRPISRFSQKIRPICLPSPDMEYTNQHGVVAGWGAFQLNDTINSKYLEAVGQYFDALIPRQPQYFAAVITLTDSKIPMDPCGGDSGGPFMWRDESRRYRVIGTVHGGGYNCKGIFKDNWGTGDHRQRYDYVPHFLGWLQDLIKGKAKQQCAVIN